MTLMERDAYTAEIDAILSAPPPRGAFPFINPYEVGNYEKPATDVKSIICYSHVDYGNSLSNRVATAFKLSASVVHPGSALAELPFECDKKSFIAARAQVFSKMRRSLRGDMMFLDTDIICNRFCDPFEDDFDIGLTDTSSKEPMQPFDGGVMFARDTPGAQMFLDAIMVHCNVAPDINAPKYLYPIALFLAYQTFKDKIKIKIFPNAMYSFAPPMVGPTDAYFVHLRGTRKSMFPDFLRYAMDRAGRRELTALPGKELTMETPVASPQALVDVSVNIKANMPLKLPTYVKRKVKGGRVAIVGYGPSLRDTWELIRGFDVIWTVSKAHDFLLERGITPTFHTDLDFREHKAYFNKIKSPSTKYILATQVHPKYLELLGDADIQLFHSDIPGADPSPGYRKAEAQFDAGLQAAYMAYENGYHEQHWFGCDASIKDGTTHAGSHSGLPVELLDIMVDGKIYTSSTLLLRQAMFGERMLCKYAQLNATIYGDGMLKPFLQERGKALVK